MNLVYSNILILLILFQIKQWLADFCFQYTYMLQKVRPGWDFIAPLSSHCLVHCAFTLLICLWYRPEMWWLVFVDFGLHFIMDRFRASPNYLGRYDDVHTSIFWRILGFDQMFHHLTHILIIWILIS